MDIIEKLEELKKSIYSRGVIQQDTEICDEAINEIQKLRERIDNFFEMKG